METMQLMQLITAICFTIVGIFFLTRRDPAQATQSRVAAVLFFIAAAINWVLFAGLVG